MILPLSVGLSMEGTSDGLLSSENLKEEKVVTTSHVSISRVLMRRVMENNVEQ